MIGIVIRENSVLAVSYTHLDVYKRQDYHFEIVPLYGHTSGQCGLVERNKKLFFCADQVILGLTPIVITAGKDQHLLAEYFASLKELTADYTGYRFLPGHYGEFTEIREETDRIISEYETRCTQLRLALSLIHISRTGIPYSFATSSRWLSPKTEIFFPQSGHSR